MLFSWLRRRRRRKLLAEPFPQEWLQTLQDHVGHYAFFNEADQHKLRDIVQIMIAEKEWEGCRGLELTDRMRVVIAGLAAVLIVGLDDFYFDNVQTVLIYPDAFLVKQEVLVTGEATMQGEVGVDGVAHRHGPVLLSWEEVSENGLNPGCRNNVVFHEFAHQLDMLNGAFDGTPNLQTNDLAQRWARVMNHEFRRLQFAERRGRDTVLDPYGASDSFEFFAVATECFFDGPRAMRTAYPELYGLFREYYRQDPAEWKQFEG